MAISIEFKDKYVYFGPEAGLHTQGEARAESYDISGPRYHDGHDLSAMTWYVRASHPDYATLINKQLRVSVDPANEDRIIVTWPVDADFTACAGQLDVQFVAKSSSGTEIIKLQSNGLQLAASVEGTATPPGNVFEDTLEQMQGFLDDAENAAAQSAAEALRAEDAQEAAASSASDAAASETSAAGSQTAAAASASAAAASETAAAASATAAASSETNAAASAVRAEQLAQGCKGWFVNVAALRAAYPTGTDGAWAILGSTDSIWVWDTDSSDWINSHKTTDLSGYYTKEQADDRFLQTEGDASNVTLAFTASSEASLDAPTTGMKLSALGVLLSKWRNWQLRASVPIGGMIMYAGSTAPDGFLLCQGQLVSRTTYAALFAVIGTTYGAGDGSTTFKLPDMQERFPLGSGANFSCGATGGTRKQKITEKNLPGFSAVLANTDELFVGDADWFGSTTIKVSSGYAYFTAARKLGSNAEAALDIMPPYTVVNYLIRV